MKDEKNKRIRITLRRSPIGSIKKHKLTIRALGLHRLHQTVEHIATPQIRGMVDKVSYLIDVEEIK